METGVESPRLACRSTPPELEIRVLGSLVVLRDGVAVTLPASRKTRALLAYLALTPQPVSRSDLCEFLWDIPNDPRGELRWSLTKIRALVDRANQCRLRSVGNTVWLDVETCVVDAMVVAEATATIGKMSFEGLQALVALFAGDVLAGLEIDGCSTFNGWLTAQRRRFRGYRAVLLEHLVRSAPDDEIIRYLDDWLAIAPFDRRVHERLFAELARNGRMRESEEHLGATIRIFESEGLDCAPIRDAWRAQQCATRSPARVEAFASLEGPASARVMAAPRRASVVVMPFDEAPIRDGGGDGTATALAHDVVTRLAKLRSVFVIAQGTALALYERRVGPEEAGRTLDVDFVVSGSVRRANRLAVTVELAETRTARIVWAERFDRDLSEAFDVLDEIGNSIVASIAVEIEATERARAILMPPNSLDAWDAHHRGLWHAYRFTHSDNDRARYFFEMAVRLDPSFSRAQAGLSFTHFQDAFQGWSPREPAVARSLEAAHASVLVDDRDPAAHLAMGRALWLGGRLDPSIAELERAVELSPNFAMGHYTLAFVHSQEGDPLRAIDSSDYSRRLSPFDPLLFGMLGARAMALVRLGRFDEAANWGIRAAGRPNAHAHIFAIAAFALALAGRLDEARVYLEGIRATLPGYGVEDFLTAMHFRGDDAVAFRAGARLLG